MDVFLEEVTLNICIVSYGLAASPARLDGESGKMVSLQGETGPEYRGTAGWVPLEIAANVERSFPEDWIHPRGNDLMPELRSRVAPWLVRLSTPRLKALALMKRVI